MNMSDIFPPDPLASLMEHVTVVLVGTTHSGNIGSCARAVGTMGAGSLRLAVPSAEINDDSRANATSSTDVLDACVIHDSPRSALADCDYSLAFTARHRHLSSQHLSLSEGVARLLPLMREGRRVALLFGNEKAGLSNEEALLANHPVEITANPQSPSLNISHALQVALYEIRRQIEKTHGSEQGPALRDIPNVEFREQMLDHFERVSKEVGIVNDRDHRPFLARLRLILMRADPDRQEINMLRGFLSAIEKRIQL